MDLSTLLKRKAQQLLELPISLIDANPAQPRQVFERTALEGLAASIQENGLLQPITVRQLGARYQLIAGERRLMAFYLLGREKIPAILEQADDDRSRLLALIENLQRRDLNFIEEAEAISALIRAQSLSQREAAARLGMAQSTLANKLRILKLSPELLDTLLQGGCTERHARALLPLADHEKLLQTAARIVSEHKTVEQTEELVASLLDPPPKPQRLVFVKDVRLFTNTIRRAIKLMTEAGIEASQHCVEDEGSLTFTITIPKQAAFRPQFHRSPTDSARSSGF